MQLDVVNLNTDGVKVTGDVSKFVKDQVVTVTNLVSFQAKVKQTGSEGTQMDLVPVSGKFVVKVDVA